ncbi:MAG: sigma-70 family RNA polymerase sigma factor [archaeon]|nr:sigma-70 family RNA polymerase sigma factor [archaeon]
MTKSVKKSTEDRDYSSNPADHLGFATSYVKKFILPDHSAFEDVKAEAILELVEAAKKYDPTIAKFVTYAKPYILKGIYNGLRKIGGLSGDTRSRRKFHSRRSRVGTDATPNEISERLDIPLDEVLEIILAEQIQLSLDQLVGESGRTERYEKISSNNTDPYTLLTEGVDDSERYKIRLIRVMAEIDLNERSRDIVIRRLGLDGEEGVTLEELGNQYNVSRERIRQLEAKAFIKIRRYI